MPSKHPKPRFDNPGTGDQDNFDVHSSDHMGTPQASKMSPGNIKEDGKKPQPKTTRP